MEKGGGRVNLGGVGLVGDPLLRPPATVVEGPDPEYEPAPPDPTDEELSTVMEGGKFPMRNLPVEGAEQLPL